MYKNKDQWPHELLNRIADADSEGQCAYGEMAHT